MESQNQNNFVVFDTETVSLEKCYCYNVGYVIANEQGEILLSRDYVVEQIWHNRPLFDTAYYADKRGLYISRMKGRKAKLEKWGRICRQMCRDFKEYGVTTAYAYNSAFDEKVFNFNCDYYKCLNPFDTIQIIDIRGYVHKAIAFKPDFQKTCEKFGCGWLTDTGNYSTTAEIIYKYITKQYEFEEEHTALADSVIELAILVYCVNHNCEYDQEYKVYSSIPRKGKTLRLDMGDSIVTLAYNVKSATLNRKNMILKIKLDETEG